MHTGKVHNGEPRHVLASGIPGRVVGIEITSNDGQGRKRLQEVE